MDLKQSSMFRKVSIAYFIWLGLYCSGMLLCRVTELEYRMWVWILGNVSLYFLFPLWLFFFWYRRHVRKSECRFFRHLAATIFTVLFLWWSYVCFITMVFSVREERYLLSGYIVVEHAWNLSPSYYELYKCRAFFFREKAVLDNDAKIRYLEKKYHQDFLEVPFDEEKMVFYDEWNGGCQEEMVVVPSAHPELAVNVWFSKSDLGDDYTEILTDWYIAEGCRVLGINRSFHMEEGERIRLHFYGGNDIEAAASDVQRLIRYVMQDEIFQKYNGMMRLSPENAKPWEYIDISFGEIDSYGGRYEKDISLLEQRIEQGYGSILEDREAARAYEEEQDRMREATEQEGAEKTDDIQESEYAKEARRIYEEVLAPKNIGEQFSIDYNARGGEYYPLGEDGNYCYTLIYDRDSENKACRLYVLYRSPYDQKGGGYYSYTDTMTQIMDIYAVAKETGEIVPSGKKKWSDTGSKAYRGITGE